MFCASCLLLAARRLAGQGQSWVAKGLSRKTIYHSPQKPGYSAWAGGWQMPDGSLMVCFTQATGPVHGRPQAPLELWEKLGIPDRGWDFTGLNRQQIYLRSVDHGKTWREVSHTSFGGVGASAYGGGATLGLPNGDILRRVNGWDLMGQSGIPLTAYLQRSTDGTRNWGEPQVLLDPTRFTYQISRIRQLADGRLLASGQFWDKPAGSSHKQMDKVRPGLLLMVSSDLGLHWRRVNVADCDHQTVWDEWDFAPLSGGNLLAVFRRGDPVHPTREARWQGILQADKDNWTLTQFRPSPLPHSGHPELLATKEGIIVYFATTGVDWTEDAGVHWHPLDAPGFGIYKTRYYPRALQARDGTIYVFAHNGWDNRYGEFDQSIDMDHFRLARRPAE